MKRKIKMIKRFVGFIVVMVILSSCIEKHYNEWVVKDGKKMYYTDAGNIIKSTYDTIGGNTYVFDEKGYVITNKIVNLDGNLRIADKEGRIMVGDGWCKINDGNDYYLKNGKVQTGWIKDGENWYYLDSNYYYKLKNQWVENKYYVDSSGKMLLDTTKEIEGKYYIFDSNGIAREKPEFELIVANYPNPIWAHDGMVRINKLNISVKDFYSTSATIEIEIDVTPVRLEYRNTNTIWIYYKIYDEEGYEVQDSFFELGDDVRSLQTIKRRLKETIKAAKNKTYKMVIYSNKTPW